MFSLIRGDFQKAMPYLELIKFRLSVCVHNFLRERERIRGRRVFSS